NQTWSATSAVGGSRKNSWVPHLRTLVSVTLSWLCTSAMTIPFGSPRRAGQRWLLVGWSDRQRVGRCRPSDSVVGVRCNRGGERFLDVVDVPVLGAVGG